MRVEPEGGVRIGIAEARCHLPPELTEHEQYFDENSMADFRLPPSLSELRRTSRRCA
jgi:hypothetical protein